MIMVGSHDRLLVFLSILLATFASYTALSLASRIGASAGWTHRVWLAGASLSLGGGIWSMHFVAMLAFSMPGMVTTYDVGLTILSLGLALAFTAAGFALAWSGSSSWRTIVAGVLMGGGVVAMHYVGMAAMRMSASLSYERPWLAASVLIAIGAAIAAVRLASVDHGPGRRVAAAALMGAAISGMHYSGMQAAVFTVDSPVDLAAGHSDMSQAYIAVAISAVTVLILLLALGAARLERLFNGYARREARIGLRLKIADVLREDDTQSALRDVAALLGDHFDVSRTGFGQLDPVDDLFDYDVCWTDGSVPPLLGRYPAVAFGAKIVAELAAGRTVVVEDLLEAELSDEERTRDTAREVDTRAILVVPFVRGGRLRTIIYLNSRSPRRWHPEDVRFMEEMAERIRLVIERAAVEGQLRELNATLEQRVEARTAELREAEEARRAADALYRAYFENTPDPLFVISVEPEDRFIIEQINPAHEAGVGFRLEDVRGRRIEDVLPSDAAEKAIRSYRHVVATGETLHYRDVFDLSGEAQHWDTTLVPLRDADGRVSRLIGTSRNVTRQIVAEEALRQSQKMEAMGQLTGGVAHDFNNLLTPIVGSLDRLLRKGVGDERDQRLLKGAVEAADRAKTLVQRLLSFARRQPLQPVPVNVGELVSGMSALIGSSIGPQIRLEIDAPADLPAALADPNQLEMALLNLSVNARDAMPNGGRLRIAAALEQVAGDQLPALRPGRYIRLSVSDTGTGMDEQTLKRAVEPFFSTKGVGQGTGLGLSMAHGLAAQLGGALTISSKPGAGTTVVLRLPEAINRKAVAKHGDNAEPVDTAGGRVLLVDDENLVRASTADMLHHLGYVVEDVASAEEALRVLESGVRFDVLVTDHLMPGMSGTELAKRVLAASPHMRVLVISGYADSDGIDPTLPRLPKPFRHSELRAMLASTPASRVA